MSENKKHQKHPALNRPSLGEFARQEWGIIGAPCSVIQDLSRKLIASLSDSFRLAYIDADHKSRDESGEGNTFLGQVAVMDYTDKIHHHRLDWRGELNSFHQRPLYNQVDGVLVNGNHFKAKRQILVIDPRKLESLRGKLDRLTDVGIVLLAEGVSELPEEIQLALGDNLKAIPVIALENAEEITFWLRNELNTAIPPIKGLVLAGGKSQRMGHDKTIINYHGLPQREHLANLLDPYCESVYLSCAPGQAEQMESQWPVIEDSFMGLGPFGAILSAFREEPDCAWLVVACDLPLLDKVTLGQLVNERNPSQIATAFHNPATGLPDPLVTVWEPRSYPILFSFLAQGYACPRKVLINSPIEELQLTNPDAIRNVNRPEDLEEVKRLLKREEME